jgi:hypothetical protein
MTKAGAIQGQFAPRQKAQQSPTQVPDCTQACERLPDATAACCCWQHGCQPPMFGCLASAACNRRSGGWSCRLGSEAAGVQAQALRLCCLVAPTIGKLPLLQQQLCHVGARWLTRCPPAVVGKCAAYHTTALGHAHALSSQQAADRSARRDGDGLVQRTSGGQPQQAWPPALPHSRCAESPATATAQDTTCTPRGSASTR